MRTKLKFVVLIASTLAFIGVANADGVAWNDLTDGQRTLLAEHADRWEQMDAARQVGEEIAELTKATGVTSIVFDRGGNKYHGRVKALAEAAREGGLKF